MKVLSTHGLAVPPFIKVEYRPILPIWLQNRFSYCNVAWVIRNEGQIVHLHP